MPSEQASSGPADDSGPWDALARVLWPVCLRSIVPQRAFPCPRRKDAEPELYQCSCASGKFPLQSHLSLSTMCSAWAKWERFSLNSSSFCFSITKGFLMLLVFFLTLATFRNFFLHLLSGHILFLKI